MIEMTFEPKSPLCDNPIAYCCHCGDEIYAGDNYIESDNRDIYYCEECAEYVNK